MTYKTFEPGSTRQDVNPSLDYSLPNLHPPCSSMVTAISLNSNFMFTVDTF